MPGVHGNAEVNHWPLRSTPCQLKVHHPFPIPNRTLHLILKFASMTISNYFQFDVHRHVRRYCRLHVRLGNGHTNTTLTCSIGAFGVL